MVIGAFVRPFIRQIGKYVYQGLRQQDRIVDYTYRKTGLYNRGVVRGIKHGLAGGQIAGGVASLGLNAPDTPGNDVGIPFQKTKPVSTTRTPYKTRNRFTNRCYPKRPVKNNYRRY